MYKLTLAFLSLFFLLGAPATAGRTATDVWMVTQLSGDARVVHPGAQPASLKANQNLAPGDTLLTGPTGRATLVRGEDYIVVAPRSELKLPSAPQPSGFTRVIQNLGTLLFKVKHTGIPHFAVDTPMLAAVVKGTTFTVVVDQHRSAVQVIQGVVQVATIDGGMSRMVEGGRTVFVDHSMPKVLRDADKPLPSTLPSSGTGVRVSAAGETPLATIASLTGGLVRADAGTPQSSAAAANSAVAIVESTVTAQPATTTGTPAASATTGAAASTPVVVASTTVVSANPPDTTPAAPTAVTPAVTTAPTAVAATAVAGTPVVTTPVVTTPAVTASPIVATLTVPPVTIASNSGPGSVNSGSGSLNSGPGSVNSGSGSLNSGSGSLNSGPGSLSSGPGSGSTTVPNVSTPTAPTVTTPVVPTSTPTAPILAVSSTTTPIVPITTPTVTVPSVTTPTAPTTSPTVTVPSITTPIVPITTPTVTVSIPPILKF